MMKIQGVHVDDGFDLTIRNGRFGTLGRRRQIVEGRRVYHHGGEGFSMDDREMD